jgi:alpha galactosidase A-like protein
MVDYGLRDLGYQYVIIDDCWAQGRNESGYLVPNSKKFPNVSQLCQRSKNVSLNMTGNETFSRRNT